jgi:hypothetical protein
MEPTQDKRRREDGPDDTRLARRPYTAPKLVEYGSVAKLTQGAGRTANGDGGQMMRI